MAHQLDSAGVGCRCRVEGPGNSACGADAASLRPTVNQLTREGPGCPISGLRQERTLAPRPKSDMLLTAEGACLTLSAGDTRKRHG